jgi:hypothetical protein
MAMIQALIDAGHELEVAEEMADIEADEEDGEATPLLVAIRQVIKFGDGFNLDMFDETMQLEMQRTLIRLVARASGIAISEQSDVVSIGTFSQTDINERKQSVLVAECASKEWSNSLLGLDFTFNTMKFE